MITKLITRSFTWQVSTHKWTFGPLAQESPVCTMRVRPQLTSREHVSLQALLGEALLS